MVVWPLAEVAMTPTWKAIFAALLLILGPVQFYLLWQLAEWLLSIYLGY